MKPLIFPNIPAPCCSDSSTCLCGAEERVLRAFISNQITITMTSEQREWCIDSADWAGEGHYNRSELSAMNDKELASAVMNAWSMYAMSNS